MTVDSALISSAHRILTGRTDDGGHAAGPDIRIVNGRIHAIGKQAPLPGESVLDATVCGMVADHHYLYHPDMPYDSSAILFEEAEALGLRFVLRRGGVTVSIGVDGAALNEEPT
ncbi:amidohydrolase family protein [Noviherbaspirillum soli]|uniref:hypothetical protein n=1 Tax=Noviherbaspirillum soli TaxID=1064518 RepID=UPI00188D4D2B|nr:hypothetical protein [Noviherbaspirillum soli]